MYQLRKKNPADSVAIYCRGRELFRPSTYINFRPSKPKFFKWVCRK